MKPVLSVRMREALADAPHGKTIAQIAEEIGSTMDSVRFTLKTYPEVFRRVRLDEMIKRPAKIDPFNSRGRQGFSTRWKLADSAKV